MKDNEFDNMEQFENFAMSIPKHCIYNINNCLVFNATEAEFYKFKEWVESGELLQISIQDEFLDFWVNKENGFGRTVATLNNWFNSWKTPNTITVHYYGEISAVK